MTSQAKKAANLPTGKLPMVIVYNHADYPGRLCFAVDPTTGIQPADVQSLAWLRMGTQAGRISALYQAMLAAWASQQTASTITPEEIHQIIALSMFLEELARNFEG